MKLQKHKEEFQLERVAFFSDAVFAIACTLLIIEIKVPELSIDKISDSILWEQLSYSIPKITGVIISFFVISLYWISHHKLFGYINRYDKRILWPNLLFLLSIIFMPFSTAYLSEYYTPDLRMPIILYTLNINFAGLASFRLWSLATNSKKGITVINDNKVLKNYYKTRALTIPLTFVFVTFISFISGWISFIILPLMPFVSFIIRRRFKKKYPAWADEF
jgi:uncharacterized membrane protein